MGRGQLDAERLDEIKRLIELEEQLEFRCGSGGSTVVARPEKRHEIPEEPAKKPSRVTETARAPVTRAEEAKDSDTGPTMETPSPERAERTNMRSAQRAASTRSAPASSGCNAVKQTASTVAAPAPAKPTPAERRW